MAGDVYAKTSKGRDEIATRKACLPARLRSLLLMIDGQRSLTALASALGPVEQMNAHAAVLLEGGLVELLAMVAEPEAALVIEAAVPAVPAVPVAPPAVQGSAPVKVSMHNIYSSRASRQR